MKNKKQERRVLIDGIHFGSDSFCRLYSLYKMKNSYFTYTFESY